MSESTLEKLRRKAKERESKKKAEASRKNKWRGKERNKFV
jgi:hypothetical protein